MVHPLRVLLVLIVLVVNSSVAAPEIAAQAVEASTEVEVVEVELVDGTTVTGTIEYETADEVVLRTVSSVEVRIPIDRIASRRALEGRIRDGRLVRADPNRTRLLFAPTARPLGNGKGYLADYQVFMPFVGLGIGDYVSMAGGVSLVPGLSSQLVYAAPKVTVIDRPEASVAAGVIGAMPLGTATGSGYGGFGFGIGTFGAPKRSVTLGAGFGFVSDDGESSTSALMLLLGGELQVSDHVKLLSENYVYVEEATNPILSGGVRFFNDTLAADLGFFTTPDAFGDGFPFIPWVGFAYNFHW